MRQKEEICLCNGSFWNCNPGSRPSPAHFLHCYNPVLIFSRTLFATRRVARIWKRGGFFERVRKVQTALTRIAIVLESVSHGLSEN